MHVFNYSVTCLNRIPMGPNILSGLDRIRITQTRIFENFLYCSFFDNKVCLLLDELQTYSTSFQLLQLCKSNVKMFFFQRHFQTKKFFSIISPQTLCFYILNDHVNPICVCLGTIYTCNSDSVFESQDAPFRTRGRNSPTSV